MGEGMRIWHRTHCKKYITSGNGVIPVDCVLN